MNRRTFEKQMFLLLTGPSSVVQASSEQAEVTAEEWISDVVVTKASDSPLKLQRFQEPIWILLEPITWKPSNSSQASLAPITVPKYFVTDLASIPRIFWALMPRDDVYAYPAIVHDYLYWTQTCSKREADQIFEFCMVDLEVPKLQVKLIKAAVQALGDGAWEENRNLKSKGEKRILRSLPSSARAKWRDWKKIDGNFS